MCYYLNVQFQGQRVKYLLRSPCPPTCGISIRNLIINLLTVKRAQRKKKLEAKILRQPTLNPWCWLQTGPSFNNTTALCARAQVCTRPDVSSAATQPSCRTCTLQHQIIFSLLANSLSTENFCPKLNMITYIYYYYHHHYYLLYEGYLYIYSCDKSCPLAIQCFS